MMGWSPRYYIPSFMEIGPPVPKKIFLKGFYHIYGHGGHLGHVTSIMSSDFHFLVPESFIKKLVQISTVASEKIWFEFLYAHDLGPRSRNDIDLQYLLSFINSLRCLLLPTFRLQKFLKNPLFSLFPIEKPMFPNLTLP